MYDNPIVLKPGPKVRADFSMTLRDYFAGQVVAGIAARGVSNVDEYARQNAKRAYAMADELLKAREVTPE